jgi:hypothetical protein
MSENDRPLEFSSPVESTGGDNPIVLTYCRSRRRGSWLCLDCYDASPHRHA